jgi:hypothetical protein
MESQSCLRLSRGWRTQCPFSRGGQITNLHHILVPRLSVLLW